MLVKKYMYQEVHVFLTNGIRESKFLPFPENNFFLNFTSRDYCKIEIMA
jgi:hypothetical protein